MAKWPAHIRYTNPDGILTPEAARFNLGVTSSINTSESDIASLKSRVAQIESSLIQNDVYYPDVIQPKDITPEPIYPDIVQPT